MKKIAAGYYKTEIEGKRVEVIKIEEINSRTKTQWYYKVNSKGGDDWYNSKSIALEAAKEAIKENIY